MSVLSVTAWLVNTILCPRGDQSGSSSTAAGLFVMFFGRVPFLRKSSTFKTKISLSVVAAPGRALIGRPVPDAEAWNAMFLPSGDQVAELPRTSGVCPVPSAYHEQMRGVEGLPVGPQPVAVEHNPFPVRRQGRETVKVGVLRHTPRVRAVPVHQVDLGGEPSALGIDRWIGRGVVARAHERNRRAQSWLLFSATLGLGPRA